MTEVFKGTDRLFKEVKLGVQGFGQILKEHLRNIKRVYDV